MKAFLPMLLIGSTVWAQSSSLYVSDSSDAGVSGVSHRQLADGRVSYLNPHLMHTHFAAVGMPAPRVFALNDLVSIIIREDDQASANASLQADKEYELNGQVTAFPSLNLADLVELSIGGSTLTNPPRVGVTMEKNFEGDGDFERRDSQTGRIQARVIDVKPNGLLVLEARKLLTNDGETLEVVLTGLCRSDDITASNTILSTQLYDLRLIRNTSGELRRATKKGVIARVLDTLFAF